MKRKKRLSDREYDVMQVLWNSTTPLLASEIVDLNSNLNINTVQAAIRKLLSREYIRVADIVQSGKGLGRTFAPVISADEYIMDEFQDILPTEKKRRCMFFNAFMERSENEETDLEELQKMIDDYRKRMVE